MRTLTALVHGESGSGKSWTLDTIPAPRLILDAEGGAQDTPSYPKIVWDPVATGPPVWPLPPEQWAYWCAPTLVDEDGNSAPNPQHQLLEALDGRWATCRVVCRDFNTMLKVYEWLNTTPHPFVSVGMDSLTEMQKRAKDRVAGSNQLSEQDWGTLLNYMEVLVRQYRDLTTHPVYPIRVLAIAALCAERGKGGTLRPAVQGALNVSLPGFVDVVGYMYVETDPTTGVPLRRLAIQPYGPWVAKDRTNKLTRAYGPVLGQRTPDEREPNIENMLRAIRAVERQDAEAALAAARNHAI